MINKIKLAHVILDLFKKKFVKDVIWTSISTFLAAVSGVLINILIVSFYNVKSLGLFSQAMAIYLIISLISIFGVHGSATKHSAELKERGEKLDSLFSASFLFTLLFSSFVTIILEIGLYFQPPLIDSELRILLKYIFLALPFFSLNKLILGFLNGLREMTAYAIAQSMRWVLIFLFIIFSIVSAKDLSFLILAFLFSELTLFIIFFAYTIRFFSFTLSGFGEWVTKHVSFGGKYAVTDMLAELNNNLDLLMIGFFTNPHFVGLYSFAATIAKNLLNLSSILAVNFNPIIVSLSSNKNNAQLTKYIDKIRNMLVMIMVPIILSAAILYPIIIKFFNKSEELQGSLAVFYILLPGIFILSLFSFCGGILSMAGYPGKQLRIMLIVVLFNITLNILVIPSLGIMGAAIVTSFSYVLTVVLMYKTIKKTLGIKLF